MKVFLPFLLFCSLAGAQPAGPFPLWPNGAPGALGTAEKDIPTLTSFLPAPEKRTGAAMVICPGGGYQMLVPHEGKEYARWLNAHGVTCFVLKYRLAPAGYHYPIIFEDGARAVRLVRAHAAEWKLDPHRIGIIGSSAGGHLASMLLTHFDSGNPVAVNPVDRESSRPDLGILCYAVITLLGDRTRTSVGSRENLLGKNPAPELVKYLSSELQVTPETPPCFIYHSVEDAVVPVQNSLDFAAALARAHVPFDLHIYEKGVHGSGLGLVHHAGYDPAKLHPWTYDCIFWLKLHHFVNE